MKTVHLSVEVGMGNGRLNMPPALLAYWINIQVPEPAFHTHLNVGEMVEPLRGIDVQPARVM